MARPDPDPLYVPEDWPRLNELERRRILVDWPAMRRVIYRELRIRLLEGIGIGVALGLLAGILIGRSALAAPRPAHPAPVPSGGLTGAPLPAGAEPPSLLPVRPAASERPTASVAASPDPSPAPETPPASGSFPRPARRLLGAASWYKAITSFYGPGFYGRRTACGLALTKSLVGVAHRTLRCGTRVEFRYGGRVIIAPVVDRGPYVTGRLWDLTGGACLELRHCFTGSIEWRLAR